MIFFSSLDTSHTLLASDVDVPWNLLSMVLLSNPAGPFIVVGLVLIVIAANMFDLS